MDAGYGGPHGGPGAAIIVSAGCTSLGIGKYIGAHHRFRNPQLRPGLRGHLTGSSAPAHLCTISATNLGSAGSTAQRGPLWHARNVRPPAAARRATGTALLSGLRATARPSPAGVDWPGPGEKAQPGSDRRGRGLGRIIGRGRRAARTGADCATRLHYRWTDAQSFNNIPDQHSRARRPAHWSPTRRPKRRPALHGRAVPPSAPPHPSLRCHRLGRLSPGTAGGARRPE